MPGDSITAFLDELRASRLLEPGQLEQLTGVEPPQFSAAHDLGAELVRRQWLTSYQVEELLRGSGRGLALGPYRLLERLGKGGMGEVFRARHEALDRVVALKVIRHEYVDEPDALVRFRREARAAARLHHPNIVTVYDAGEDRGTHFIAMEYVEGTDLAQRLEGSGPLPPALACEYVRQAALGLEHAHEEHLVHRDIKPSNLVVTRKGGAEVVKILDFGLARFLRESKEETALTPTDAWLGTPDYIAPEQARDSRGADIRADIFSLGCTLFYLLTGRSAFPGSNRTEKLAARLSGDATPVQAVLPRLAPEVARVLERMLARDPAARYQTPAGVAEALAPFASGAAPVGEGAEGSARPAVAEAAVSTTPRTETPAPAPVLTSTTPAVRPRSVARPALAVAVLLALLLGPALLALRLGLAPAPPGTPAGPPPALTNSIGMKLVRISEGSFLMGSPDGEEGRKKDEGPQHEVRIERPFYLGACEVTQGEYRQVMGVNPSNFGPNGPGKDKVDGLDTDRLPVEMVRWDDAMEFCRQLSASPAEQAAGRTYRLPTEAEWEYACRAGTKTPFAFGKSLSAAQANFNGKRPYGGAPPGMLREYTVPVGSFPANAWGLADMHGNVWEWCEDRYLPYADRIGPAPAPPGAGSGRVLRGGGWFFSGEDCRSARRFFSEEDRRSPYYGFRAACDAAPPGPPR
jgi:formylglycine-generating enzyme required for sulfatase activity/tRNA A-37 threonylcarbamoyl transferase component Bud32